MYDDIFDKVIPSKYLREYLKSIGPNLGVDTLEDIIYNSPVSIDVKLKLLESIKDIVEEDEHNKSLLDGTEDKEKHGMEDIIKTREIRIFVPYKPGDILEEKGAPYTPNQRIVIIDVGDNWDCCCVQGLYLNEEDEQPQIGAVKHGEIRYGFNMYRNISPLYTADFFTGPLEPREKIFEKVSAFLAGDEVKGQEMVHALWMDSSEEGIEKWIEERNPAQNNKIIRE